MNTSPGRVLLTGAAGRLGRAIRPYLAPQCEELRLTDRLPFEACHRNEAVVVCDLQDTSAHARLLDGVDAVVHFAGYPREADWSTLLAANITTVAHLWESAARAGVRRMVYASSNHAVGLYPRSERLDASVLPRPDSRYGVSKVFMESVASLYAAKCGLKGFGLRIGHCAPVPSDARMLSHWIHPEDLAELIRVGLVADYECEIVYGVSDNTRSWWDNQRAHALGYRPRHSADGFIDALDSVRSDDPVAEHYQGGSFAADGYDAQRLRRT